MFIKSGKSQSVMVLVIANYVITLIGILVGVTISQKLGNDSFGFYGKIKAVFGFYSALSAGSITSAVLVVGGKKNIRKLYELGSIQMLIALISLLTFLLFVSGDFVKFKIYYSFALISVSLSTFFSAMLLLREMYLPQAVALLGGSSLSFLGWLAFGASNDTIHYLVCVPSIITLTVQWIYLRGANVRFRVVRPRYTTLVWLLGFLGPILISSVIVSRVVAELYVGLTEGLEYLELSRSILNLLLVIPTIWLQTLLPNMDKYIEAKIYNVSIEGIVFLLSLLLAGISYLFMPLIFELYDIDFCHDNNPLMLFLLAYPFACWGLYNANIILYKDESKKILYANILFAATVYMVSWITSWNILEMGLSFIVGYLVQGIYLKKSTGI